MAKHTLALSETPTKDNSPVTETSYTVAALEDGVYSVTTQKRYNATGQALTSTQKQLISQLSVTLERKTLSLSERDLTSTQWSVYDTGTKRMRYSSVPTSNITAETVTVDGFARSQKDTAGIITSATRAYTSSGMVFTNTDGRGNSTTTVTDIAGRTTSVTDAAGNVTTTAYDIAHDLPALITDAQGNITCYRYDARGRNVAEWGTAIQSPRGLGGGLDKARSGFAPEGRAGNGVPAQWSSECHDEELGLVYYNCRHYNPHDGRGTGRDIILSNNEYCYVRNQVQTHLDVYGKFAATLAAPALLGTGALLPVPGIVAGAVAIYAAGVAADVYDTWEREAEQEEIRKQRCSELRAKKQEFAKRGIKGATCKGLKASKCPDASACQVLADKMKKFEEAIKIRDEYDRECFDGGDVGHKYQITALNNGLTQCRDYDEDCIRKLNRK